MGYAVNIEGFEGQNIEFNMGFWSGAKLLVNGDPAPKGEKRGTMTLTRNDGRPVTASWKPQFMGLDVPQLVVDGKTINVAEPLKWYQWGWSALPILLVFMGGFLGALAGFIGFSINANIFRTKMNPVLKYVVTGAVSLVAGMVYFVLGSILYVLING